MVKRRCFRVNYGYYCNIDVLAVPVSCNTAIEKSKCFKDVILTKIGSPYVIAEFEKLTKEYAIVDGFEANGGFLLGSNIKINGKQLNVLPTRDTVLPVIMLLLAANEKSISACIS